MDAPLDGPSRRQRRRRAQPHGAEPVGRRRPRHHRRSPPSTAPPSRPAAATPRSSPSTPPAPPAPTAGATLVVTLEPCSHPGAPARAPMLSRGRRRPGRRRRHRPRPPRRRRRASSASPAAGIDVEVGVERRVVADQLAPYLHHRRTGRPYVVLKLAATLDGRTAAPDGSSRWITGPEARADAHRLRAESDAVLVGAGTVRADDPELTVRDVRRAPDPLRVVLGHAPEGARVHPCLELGGDLGEVLDTLGGKGVLQVLVEGGPTVAGALPPRRARRPLRPLPRRRRSSAATTAARCSPARARPPSPTPGGAAITGVGTPRRRPPHRPRASRASADVHRHRRGARHRRRPRRSDASGSPAARCSTTSSLGASIAVNGCCLTVVAFDAARAAGGRPTPPTRPSPARTSATSRPATRSTSSGRSAWPTGSAATSCRATSTASAPSPARARPRVSLPDGLARYIVEKGSITVDGVSLTVVEAGRRRLHRRRHPAHRRGHHARPQGPGRPRQPRGRRHRQVRRTPPHLEG